jgi:hypothetical protein
MFFAGAGNANTPQALRQKIALAMLMQKRKAPSTFGEGLSAIGDSLGDIGMMRRIESEAAAAEQAATGAESRILGGGGAPQAVAPGSPPPVQAAAMSAPSSLYSPSPSPTDQTPVPGDVQEGAPPAGPLFRPGVSRSAAAPLPPAAPAVPTPPDQQQSYAPGAPVRMSSDAQLADFRAQNPLPPGAPPVPQGPPAVPQQPGGARPTVADFGQKPVLAPTPPVMARGAEGEDPRRAIALAMLRQGQTGQPQGQAFAPAVAAPPADQGIRPAPLPAPPAPRAAAPPPAPPAQDLPEAGYITPLPPPRQPPPLTTPRMQEIEQAIRAAPPSVRESVQARLMPLYEKEKGGLAQAHEAYKDKLIQDRALELKHHEQKAAARASVDASREAAQRIAKGSIPEVKQDIETGLTFNAVTGQWEQPRIAGADPDKKPVFKGTEFQGKALVNYGRARLAQDGLKSKPEGSAQTYDEILASSPVQSAMTNFTLPVVGKVAAPWRDAAYKEADTYAENYVQAFIRQQSGGAYTDPELEKEARAMLPKYGDTAKQLQDKREQREQFLSGMYSIIGTSGQKGADIDARQREAGRTAVKPDPSKPDPLEGREILMPDKTIKVRRDGKWVPK